MNRISRLKLVLCLPAILLGYAFEAPAEVILLGGQIETFVRIEYTTTGGEEYEETVSDSTDTFAFADTDFQTRIQTRTLRGIETALAAFEMSGNNVNVDGLISSMDQQISLLPSQNNVASRDLKSSAMGTLQFQVTQRPAEIFINAAAYGLIEGPGTASVMAHLISGASETLFEFEASGDLSQGVQRGGDSIDLDPGVYTITATGMGEMMTGPKGASDNDLEIFLELSFSVGQEEASVEEITWDVISGDYNQATNWEPQQVPGAGQTSIFDTAETYVINFGDEESSRALIKQGAPTFSGGSYNVLGGSEESPSLVVGATSVSDSTLTLANHQLESLFSTIGSVAGTNTNVVVENGSSWIEQGRLVVGYEGIGSLKIHDFASVKSSETSVGERNFGQVNVSQEVPFKGGVAEWITGNLAIGFEHFGTVNQYGGVIQSDEVYLGFNPDSTGVAVVGSEGNSALWRFGRVLSIGTEGDSRMTVTHGAVVMSESDEADMGVVDLGVYIGSDGYLGIEDPGSTLMVPGLAVSIAKDGTGEMTVRNQALVMCNRTLVANTGVGNGTLLIGNSTWKSATNFVVGEPLDTDGGSGKVTLNSGVIETAIYAVLGNGKLEGVGLIIGDVNFGGQIAPGIVVSPFKGPSNENAPIGELTIQGDVEMDGALLEIEIGGLAEGDYDVIHATGSINIQSATVRFVFVDGFLPRMGDQVAFLIADGTTSVTNLTTIFEGVAEGFMFDVMEENGMLMFKALNDAQPEGGEPTPVPTALNPATDINGDNIVDASDLLEVMRNWYHVVTE